MAKTRTCLLGTQATLAGWAVDLMKPGTGSDPTARPSLTRIFMEKDMRAWPAPRFKRSRGVAASWGTNSNSRYNFCDEETGRIPRKNRQGLLLNKDLGETARQIQRPAKRITRTEHSTILV